MSFIVASLAACVLLWPGIAYASPSGTVSGGNGSVHVFAFEGTDAILIESDGLFGMVDSGEDDDYPDGSDPRYPLRDGTVEGGGHVDEVIEYLKSRGVTSANFVFYIGTHAHSDHIGSADEIITTFKPEYVYAPLYDDSFITNPAALWDNQYVYDRMLAAANEVRATLIQEPTQSQRVFSLGSLTLETVNCRDIDEGFRVGDANDYSWGVKVSDGSNTMFLAGDINNNIGSENFLAKYLGRVDAIKLGHHGYTGSSTPDFIKALSPSIAVLTGWKSSLPDEVSDTLFSTKTRVISADEVEDIGKQTVVLTFTGNGIVPDISYDPMELRFHIRNSSPHVTAYRNFTPVSMNGWARDGDAWYWFDNSSVATESDWVQLGGDWYYLKSNAQMATRWERVGGAWYYFDSSGVMQTGWVKVGGAWYYLSSSGAMLTGWQRLGGAWYFFDSSGAMMTGWVSTGGHWYYLKDTGAMATGWVDVDGTWYYTNGSGAMLTGWQWVDGAWYYLKGSGAMATGWASVGGTWYYLDPASGAMRSGWILDGKTWYYTDGSGAMRTGWLKLGGTWYYLNASGAMAAGWKSIGGVWYYLDPESGAMATGWRLVDGTTWYYLDASGAMAVGWKNVGGIWYFLKDSGAMATGWVDDGGTWYYTDGSGAMQTGWLKLGGTWYYLNASGAMATGWQTIGGVDYFFDDSGAWVEHPVKHDASPDAARPGGVAAGSGKALASDTA